MEYVAKSCNDNAFVPCQYVRVLSGRLRVRRAEEREDEESGRFYYYCEESQEVSWSHPQDVDFRDQIKMIRARRTFPQSSHSHEPQQQQTPDRQPLREEKANSPQPQSTAPVPNGTPNATAKAKARSKAKKALFSRLEGNVI